MLNDEIAKKNSIKKKDQMKNNLKQPQVNLSNLRLDSWFWDNHIKIKQKKLQNSISRQLNIKE